MRYGYCPRKRPDKLLNTIFLSVLCMAGMHAAFAQTDSSVAVKPKLFFNFDARGTFIQRKHINIFGVNAGVTFGEKRNRITAGYYWLGYNASRRLINWHNLLTQTLNFSYYTATDVRFMNFAYWHTAIRNRRWVLSTPLEIGIGNESTRFRDLFDGIASGSRKDYFIPVQAGVYGEYRALRWAGINSQIGYRNALSSGQFRQRFRGFYYSYGVNLYPGAIWKDLKKWNKRKSKAPSPDNSNGSLGN